MSTIQICNMYEDDSFTLSINPGDLYQLMIEGLKLCFLSDHC
jgi:hypothetical protein